MIAKQPNLSISKWFLYLFVGWGLAVIGLFLAIVASTLLINLGTPEWIWNFTQAIVFTSIVVLVMFFLQRKMEINIWSFIRLTSFKKGFLFLMLGISVPILLVVLGAIIGHSIGLITIQGVNFSAKIFLQYY